MSWLRDAAIMTFPRESGHGLRPMLARAVTLIGVQGTLAILLDRPTDALKVQRFADRANPNPLPITAFKNLPSNRWWGYVPAVKADTEGRMFAGEGATSPITGDIKYSLKGTSTDRKLAIAHETVHRILTPKVNVLRGLRGFMRAQGYNRSHLLVYLEEAFAETYAQLRIKGITSAYFIEGIRFPVTNGYVTVGQIRGEVKAIFLGPIIVGGMTYQVWFRRNLHRTKNDQRRRSPHTGG